MRSTQNLILILVLLWAAACGGRRRITPQSPLDSAQVQYDRGVQALAEGDLRVAQAQFDRAHGLDENFAGSFVGDALVALAQGDHFRARQAIEQALHRDDRFVDAHIALGRIVADEGLSKGRNSSAWLEESTRSYVRAGELEPERADADFYLGQSQALAGDVSAALASYQRVIGRNRGPLVVLAMAEAERLQVIQRAAPGTRVGSRIAAKDEITRAELVVLLLEEMKLEQLVSQRRGPDLADAFRPPSSESDETPIGQQEPGPGRLKGWADPWVQRALQLGLAGLEPLPDGSFGEDAVVTRANFARVVEGILSLLTDDDDLPTRYVGESSRFADVREGHFSYNAIALSVDRGIMRPDPVTGLFRPEAPVSGAEALLIIRELQNAVRMEF